MTRIAAAALVLSLAAASPLAAQGGEEQAVLAVVTRLFDGMRQRDSAMVRSVFAPKAQLGNAMLNREGQPAYRLDADGVEGFVKAVGGATGDTWDEKIFDPEVRVDGNLATVWTYYEFWLGTTFSHCGVDAFQLAKGADGWKIVALIDTRRKEGCRK